VNRTESPTAVLLSHELLAREAVAFQAELVKRAVLVRSRLALLCVALGVIDFAWEVLPGPWELMFCAAGTVYLLNRRVAERNRQGQTRPWHFWGMLCLDTLTFALLVASLGDQGYLGIPFIIFAAAGYAMGHTRAAWVQYVLACVVYPLARAIGMLVAHGKLAPRLVAVESLCLVTIGWMSIAGPIRFSGRVRRVRRALADLERGDFGVRLPTRAHDDVGFLGISFNVTAEALGSAMRRLEDEVEERGRAEESMRQTRHEATRMASRMAAVAEAAAPILGTDSTRALAEALREACEHVLPVDDFALILNEADGGTLRVLGTGTTSDFILPLDEAPPVRRVIEERRTILCDEWCGTSPGSHRRLQGRVLRTPVMVEQRVEAVMSVCSSTTEVYGAADIAVFEALGALASTALRNILLVDELRTSHEALSHQAYHDGLTGLANRRRLRERVAGVLADSPREVAVLAVDLDGFKDINDTLGHAAGDQVLQAVAERLLNATRGRDLVARLGGDEFAIVLEQVPDEAHAVVVADRVLRAVSAPLSVDNRVFSVGASIGIAFGQSAESAHAEGADAPVAGDDQLRTAVDELLHRADMALYQAKRSGRSCWVVFDASMEAEDRERQQLAANLRAAFARRDVQLRYQSVHAMASGRVRGVAVEVQWRDVTRGGVPADLWVAAAEASGLSVDLGHWMLGQACDSLRRWQALQRGSAAGVDEAPLFLLLPVTRSLLLDDGYLRALLRTLHEGDLPAGSLMLEVPESAILPGPAVMRERLQRLRTAGARIAIGDFGMNAVPLDYLHEFPADALTLGGAFVQGVARGGSQTALARTMLALGAALTVETIAEGVDHPQQQALLQSLGCDLGMGRHYHGPVSSEALTALLSANALAPERALAGR
jgi:diguanylate cyclase (GGDEF)-like protein